MKRLTVLILGISIIVVVFSIVLTRNRNTNNTLPALTPRQTIAPDSESDISPSPKPIKVTHIKIFLVALEDEGKSGEKIGCGDSIIPIDVPIASTTMPLTAAINQLLSIKSRYYGQYGLYDALYKSILTLDKASISNGVATVYLSGYLNLGGVCDNPRVEAQLTQTVLQFSTVQKATIFINNIPLHNAVSEM